ncbi:MAG: DsbC family protein [Gammaproteobacteria bacterium]|nr:DsbC family protein [Gammaproteobacteria bacterium]
MLKNVLAAALLATVCLTPLAGAEDAVPEAVRKMLTAIIPDQTPDAVRAAPIGGFYEVTYGAETFYLSADGRYLLQGDLLDLKTQVNLTEKRRSEHRLALMRTVKKEDAIVFSPQDKPRHTVYVFTDIDCGYCRQMHKEMKRYNDLGIEIRYLAYPRTGIDSPSYDKAVSVWCADDRKAALTEAKAGRQPPERRCDNPVDAEFSLGGKLGVNGTPTLVFSDGSMLPGYLNPAQLTQYLNTQLAN